MLFRGQEGSILGEEQTTPPEYLYNKELLSHFMNQEDNYVLSHFDQVSLACSLFCQLVHMHTFYSVRITGRILTFSGNSDIYYM